MTRRLVPLTAAGTRPVRWAFLTNACYKNLIEKIPPDFASSRVIEK
jgi:hypothetical protein